MRRTVRLEIAVAFRSMLVGCVPGTVDLPAFGGPTSSATPTNRPASSRPGVV